MLTLTQNELTSIHAMQSCDQLTKQDLVYLDVAANKIMANCREIREKLGIKRHTGRRITHTNINQGDKLKHYLTEPRTHEDIQSFLNLKNRTSVIRTISQVRRRYKMCICLVSDNHYKHLPEYDNLEKQPTSFGHYLALEMIKAKSKLTKDVLFINYGVKKSDAQNALIQARRHKKKFIKILERSNEKKEIHSSVY